MHSCQYRVIFFPRWSALAAAAIFIVTCGFAGAQAPPVQPKPAPHGRPSPHEPQAHPAKPIGEDELRQQFQGKTVYLRGGYLDYDLRFDQEGRFTGNAPQASYTLSMFEVDRVHVSKRKVELVGTRFGLHFLGDGPAEDPLSASDKVRITPKKKIVRITIQRADVVKAKKEKRSKDESGSQSAPAPQSGPPLESPEASVRTQARANQMLRDALDRVFSLGLDDKMIASMPDYWRLYYKGVAGKSVYTPANPSVLRQNTVDQKARLITIFQPDSNDFAQKAGVAGVALYHVVVGPDGKPAEIAVGRPIGFGLDENAVAAIRKASFQPAVKDGKPVPVLLDLFVQFRIYSKRTGAAAPEDTASTTVNEQESPSLPGPYSASEPATKQP